MTVRRLAPDDWAIFRDIRLEMLSEAPGAFGSCFADWAAKTEAEVRSWLAANQTFAAFDRRRILASATFARAQTRAALHRAEVIAVYTRPEARGQGLLQGLLQQLADAARAAGVLQLELQVADWNSQAISAYERAGFARHGVIPRAVCHNGVFADDIFMVWPLDRG